MKHNYAIFKTLFNYYIEIDELMIEVKKSFLRNSFLRKYPRRRYEKFRLAARAAQPRMRNREESICRSICATRFILPSSRVSLLMKVLDLLRKLQCYFSPRTDNCTSTDELRV